MSDGDYPYPMDDTRTHWEGCWRERGHHNCAVAKVYEVQRQAKRDAELWFHETAKAKRALRELEERILDAARGMHHE